MCEVDSYCCNNGWDSICVGEVESLGCGTCRTACDQGSQFGDVGAYEPHVQACVCSRDSYCCNNRWDSLCVQEVESFGCEFTCS